MDSFIALIALSHREPGRSAIDGSIDTNYAQRYNASHLSRRGVVIWDAWKTLDTTLQPQICHHR